MTVTPWKSRLAGACAFALFLLVALHLYLNSRRVQGSILARVKKTLLTQFEEVELGDRLSVGWIGRVTFGPLTLSDATRPIFTANSVTITPAYLALLVGRLEPAAITFDKAGLDLDHAKDGFEHFLEKRRRKSDPLAQPQERALSDIDIRVDGLHIQTERAGLQRPLRVLDPLSGQFTLRRSAAESRIEGKLMLNKGGYSTFDVQLKSDGTAKLNVNCHAPHLGQMFDADDDLPFAVKDGDFRVELSLEAEQNFRKGRLRCAAKVRKLQLAGERLGSDTLGPMNLSGEATVAWDEAGRDIQLVKTDLGISNYAPLPFEVTGRFDLRSEPNVELEVVIQKLDFQKLLRALPAELSPGDEVPAIDGVLSAQFRLKGPVRQPEQLELTAKLDLTGLHPLNGSSTRLANSFEFRPAGGHGPGPVIVGDKNPSFAPLARTPPFLVSAVLLSEDAGFFGHRGFDFQEIKASLAEATEEKRARGASTITQQLAKNLYLSRERTYGRKIREAIATLALEASLPKSRILEIYLNIIEWGPGIYGIGEAAQHYFGRDATELTPKEAAFLATIIPNPIKYHAYYRHGALSEVWEKRVRDLLIKMRDRGVLDEKAFAEANEAPIVFASTETKN